MDDGNYRIAPNFRGFRGSAATAKIKLRDFFLEYRIPVCGILDPRKLFPRNASNYTIRENCAPRNFGAIRYEISDDDHAALESVVTSLSTSPLATMTHNTTYVSHVA